MELMSIYNRLPVSAQNLACIYEGYKIKNKRFNKTFKEYLLEYQARDEWEPNQIIQYRDLKLQRMIKHCYFTVPYYKRLFDELKVDYRDIKSLKDLSILPILNKEIVNYQPKEFISNTIKEKDLIRCHTSGTTGSGFIFYSTQAAINEQWAVWWRYREKLGIKYGTWCAVFGSKLIVPVSQTKPPFWRYNTPNHQIYFSGFHENTNNLYEYYKEICKRKIIWIHGFPSLLIPLANFMLANDLKFTHKVSFVTIGAENLMESQSKIIQKAFGVKPKQHYGLAEGTANFSEQKEGKILVDEDFAAVEFIDSDIPGSKRVIGTNLTNFAMPFLRWDTKDLVTISDFQGGIREILSIDGRSEDYVVLPNGTRIGKLDHVFKDTVHFSEVQIYQKKDYSITVYAVKADDKWLQDEKKAIKLLRESLGHDIDVKFVYVTHLARTKGQKIRFVESEVNR